MVKVEPYLKINDFSSLDCNAFMLYVFVVVPECNCQIGAMHRLVCKPFWIWSRDVEVSNSSICLCSPSSAEHKHCSVVSLPGCFNCKGNLSMHKPGMINSEIGNSCNNTVKALQCVHAWSMQGRFMDTVWVIDYPQADKYLQPRTCTLSRWWLTLVLQ